MANKKLIALKCLPSKLIVCASVLLLTIPWACGKKNSGGQGNGGDNGGTCGPQGGCGSSGPSQTLKPQASLSGSLAILVVDPAQTGQSLMLQQHNETADRLGLVDAPRFSLASSIDITDAAAGLDSPDFSLAMLADSGSSGTKTDGSGSLQKVDKDGNVQSAMSVKKDTNPTPENQGGGGQGGGPGKGPGQSLPKVLTIAVSPQKDVYLHFERAFTYRDAPEGTDPNDMAGGYQCQIFRVKGGTLDVLQSSPVAQDLECIDNKHFINNWQATRSSVFQFDSAGNIYYPGSLPNSPGMVVYRLSRDLQTRTEVINSNICVQDFLVTPRGGAFYTGTSSCQGSAGGGKGGFFRYVAPGTGASVTEIARDWYNFIFEPITGDTTDKAIFFGPDPTSSTTASWNSACVFKFDPSGASATARISNVITCGGDIWSWVNMSRSEDTTKYSYNPQSGNNAPPAAWKTEFNSRCTSEGQVFAGGGSQISSIKQDSKGNVFVIGNVRRKNAGVVTCHAEVRGPHCVVSGVPMLAAAYADSSSCATKSGTWTDVGRCSLGANTTSATCFTAAATWNRDNVQYRGISGDICSDTNSIAASDFYSQSGTVAPQQVTTAATNTVKFNASSFQCAPKVAAAGGGDQWTSEYQGFAQVTAATKTLTLLSVSTEQAIKLWMVDDVPYYSSYDNTQGKYFLKRGTDGQVLASNLEVYNLSKSPEKDGSGANRLYFDGLDFSNNSYSFGTISPTNYEKKSKTGLTGTLKTVVLLPQ